MLQKKILRKKYFSLRKKKYYDIKKKFFYPLINFIKSKSKKKKIKLAMYYPFNYEINVLKLLENNYLKKKHFTADSREK